MAVTIRRAGIAACVASLLQSCGGGGGGNDGGGNPPPPPPPPPPASELVQLVDTAAPGYASVSFYAAEDAYFAMLQLTRAAQELQRNALATLQFGCSTSGTVTLSATDRDADTTVSAGDRLAVTYSACDDAVSGTYVVELGVAAYDGDFVDQLAGDLSYDIDFLAGEGASLEGGGDFSFTATDSQLTWLVTDLQDTYRRGTFADILRDGRVEKVFSSDGTYALSFAGEAESDAFGGTVLVETDPPFRGAEGQWPTIGRLTVTGRDDGTIRYSPGFDPDTVSYELDVDGNGVLDDLARAVAWSEVSSGYAFGASGDTGIPPPNTGPNIFGRHIALEGSARDIAVNASRGQVYVTVPAEDELLVFSGESLEVVRRVRLSSGPAGVSVSADGSEIFVGLAGSGAVAIVNADSFAVSSIFVAAELGSAQVYKAVETEPGVLYVSGGSPGSQGHLVRVDRGTGTITPVATAGFADIELLADPAQRAVYAGDGAQAPTPTVRKIDARDADSDLLLSAVQEIAQPTNRMSLDPAAARLYLANGRVLDSDDFSAIGRINAGVPAVAPSGTEVLVARGERDIDVHSTETLGLIDTLETDCWETVPGSPFGAAQRLLPSPVAGQWLILGDKSLCVIDTLHPETPPGTGNPGLPPEPPPVVVIQAERAHWGNATFDAAYDEARKRLYVTLFSSQDLVTVDADTAAVLSRDPLGYTARGIALSPDGSTLAIMSNDDGHVEFRDVDSGTTETRDLSALLGTPAGYDVAWLDDDTLYATADPPCCDEPFVAYLVRVSRSNPAADVRSAGGADNLFAAELAISPDGQSLFLNRSLNEALKVDLTLPGEPIVETVAQDTPGLSNQGFTHPRLSPDGARIAYANGRILRTSDLLQVGELHPGKSVFSPDGATLYSSIGSFLDRFDAATLMPVDQLQPNVNCQPPQQVVATADGATVVSLFSGGACFYRVNLPIPARAAAKAAPSYICGKACLLRKAGKTPGSGTRVQAPPRFR